MLASMMQQPLLVSSLLQHAERHHGSQEIVSRRVEGDIHRYTLRDLAERARRMANAVAALGLARGQRAATLAWNASSRRLRICGTCARDRLAASCASAPAAASVAGSSRRC